MRVDVIRQRFMNGWVFWADVRRGSEGKDAKKYLCSFGRLHEWKELRVLDSEALIKSRQWTLKCKEGALASVPSRVRRIELPALLLKLPLPWCLCHFTFSPCRILTGDKALYTGLLYIKLCWAWYHLNESILSELQCLPLGREKQPVQVKDYLVQSSTY